MKRFFLPAFLGLTLALEARAQTSPFYINDGVVSVPPQTAPQIDATNFVNNGFFFITNFDTTIPYDTSNTRNFTNRNVMRANVGFRFDTAPTESGVRRRAANFVNVGAVNETNASIFGATKLLIAATNIISKGLLNIGVDGLMRLEGDNVDLTRGVVKSEGFTGTIFDIGLFDRYWGVGTNTMVPTAILTLPNPRSPFHIVTNLSGSLFFPYLTSFQQLNLTNGAQAFVFTTQFSATNFDVQVVFLSNTNQAITTDVRFPGNPIIEWKSVLTNAASGLPFTNLLYLIDLFGTTTNLQVIQNFDSNPAIPTFRPFNYIFTRNTPFGFPGGPSANTPFDPSIFDGVNQVVGHDYSGYGVRIAAVSTMVDTNVPGASFTNLPGNIEITADAQLNLTRTRIESLNYLKLRATNHFVGSTNAVITSPTSDINLGSTNGILAITNLLRPFVERIVGDIDLWSARWTNAVVTPFSTNVVRYHVLMVDSRLAPNSPATVRDFLLRSTNVIISDTLNIFGNLLIDAEQLTVRLGGNLNLTSSEIIWSTSLPRLQNFTNEGGIRALNAVYFGGARREPHFNGNFDEPYQTFVNRGTIATEGNLIWANTVENSGTISSGVGPITLQSVSAVLTNGVLSATNADVTIYSHDLFVSNHVIHAGRKLSLAVTNQLSDGGATNNFWQVQDGFDLLIKPASGDLLGTTVTNTAFTFAESITSWAGEDRGNSVDGYINNAALGRLVLDGGFESQFTFAASGGNNAIYVDYLELKNTATNFTSALVINPNMKVYFANANLPAEKLATHPSGRLCWVTNYTGLYSSTNIVYPSGQTNTFNTALVQSCNLDSDGDGLVNCSDPTPIATPDALMLSVSLANLPPLTAFISWEGLANSTNFLYAKSNMLQPSWRLLTNFIYGPVNGRITISDPASTNSPCFYRVRVDPRQQ